MTKHVVISIIGTNHDDKIRLFIRTGRFGGKALTFSPKVVYHMLSMVFVNLPSVGDVMIGAMEGKRHMSVMTPRSDYLARKVRVDMIHHIFRDVKFNVPVDNLKNCLTPTLNPDKENVEEVRKILEDMKAIPKRMAA